MVIREVAPVFFEDGSERSNLDDITYACVQCDTTLTRTVRS